MHGWVLLKAFTIFRRKRTGRLNMWLCHLSLTDERRKQSRVWKLHRAKFTCSSTSAALFCKQTRKQLRGQWKTAQHLQRDWTIAVRELLGRAKTEWILSSDLYGNLGWNQNEPTKLLVLSQIKQRVPSHLTGCSRDTPVSVPGHFMQR